MKHTKIALATVLILALFPVGAATAFGAEDATATDESAATVVSLDDTTSNSTGELVDQESAAQSTDEGLTTQTADPVLTTQTAGTNVTTIAGTNRYDTAAKEALEAYDTSDCAVIVSGGGFADALTATGLAGALNCPILLSSVDYLPEVTSDALETLGATKVVIVGGTSSISDAVENTLKASYSTERISGADRYLTQIAIYDYGVKNNLWASDTVFVATANGFADALSIAPVAYAMKAPIFLVDSTGELPDVEARSLLGVTTCTKAVVLGGTGSVSDRSLGFLQAVVLRNGGSRDNVIRLSGDNRYATSLAIATWAVQNEGFTWDGAAFTSGDKPYDALAGCALQGKSKSVLLLVNDSNTSVTSGIDASQITTGIKFLGGYSTISYDTRSTICNALGVDFIETVYTRYDISLSKMASIEDAADSYNYCTYQEFYDALNPSNCSVGDDDFYQFAVLNDGYSGVATDEQLNDLIDDRTQSRSSTLKGTAAYFREASQTYGMNEIALLSIAGLESGWGTSALAAGFSYAGGTINGTTYPAGTYYNYFGIGASDANALSGGQVRAVEEGWNSPETAIVDGCRWICQYYLNNGYGPQNTFYKMKWDLYHATSSSPSVWHQYCTGCTWQVRNASVMAGIYSELGISMEDTGLTFDVPVYSGS